MKHAECPGEQHCGEPAATMRRQRGDEAKSRYSRADPYARQAHVRAAGRIDGDQVGGRVELRVERLLVEIAGIPLPSGGAGNVLAQGFIKRPQIILKSVGS